MPRIKEGASASCPGLKNCVDTNFSKGEVVILQAMTGFLEPIVLMIPGNAWRRD